jgi:hypothetical protein
MYECFIAANAARVTKPKLLEELCSKTSERIVLHGVVDLDRVAADLAVFDIRLTPNGKIKEHRNFFPAIRACEGVFHGKTKLQ